MAPKKRRTKYRPAWRDDPRQDWARAVKRRDKECKVCGKRGRLQAHHIIPASLLTALSLDVNNGITLCQFHHVELHRARLDIELLPKLYAYLQEGRSNLNLLVTAQPEFRALRDLPVKRQPAHEILRVVPKDYAKAVRERWPEFAATYLTADDRDDVAREDVCIIDGTRKIDQ